MGRITGKYVGSVQVAQYGGTVLVIFKNPTSNKDKNSVYWYKSDTDMELLGTYPASVKEGNADAAILPDGTVLLFVTASLTGPGGDAELHSYVMPKKVPVQGMPNFTVPTVTYTSIDTTARSAAQSAQSAANNARTIADSANSKAKALESKVKALEARPINTNAGLTESQVADIVWSKVADRLYYELGLENSGVKGRIIDLIRTELGK